MSEGKKGGKEKGGEGNEKAESQVKGIDAGEPAFYLIPGPCICFPDKGQVDTSHDPPALPCLLPSSSSSLPPSLQFTYAEVDAGGAADGLQAFGTVPPRIGGSGVLI
jgi:hypothetical protein